MGLGHKLAAGRGVCGVEYFRSQSLFPFAAGASEDGGMTSGGGLSAKNRMLTSAVECFFKNLAGVKSGETMGSSDDLLLKR